VFTFVIMVSRWRSSRADLMGKSARERGAVAAGDELVGGGRAARGARGMPAVRPAAAHRRSAVAQGERRAGCARCSPVAAPRRRRRVRAVYPFVATPFFTFQIGAQSLALGLIALSLTFLGGYGGMVSLAQMTVAGFAAYLLAIFGTSSNARSASAGRGGSRSCSRSRWPRCSPRRSAGSRCAPRASTRS
jgi:hypothetical protein